MNASLALAALGRVRPFAWGRRAYGRLWRPSTLAWLALLTVGWFAVLFAFLGFACIAASCSIGTWTIGTLVKGAIVVFSVAPAVMVADEAIDDGKPAWASYATALVVGIAIAVAASAVVKHLFNFNEVYPESDTGGPLPVNVYNFVFHYSWRIAFAMCGVLVYADLRATRLADKRRRDADLARVHARRRTLESQLQAMQARVEPQFLFDTLAQVRRLYEQDPTVAERVLDDLIGYLRAAMPQMRDSASTVGQEIELARAYLDIVTQPLGDRFAVQVEMPEDVTAGRMPPMMLLPLIEQALVRGSWLARGGGMLRIGCAASVGRLRVAITDGGGGFSPEANDERIAGIRERLTALYADEAKLELGGTGGGATQVIIEIPFEDTRRSAPGKAVERGLATVAA